MLTNVLERADRSPHKYSQRSSVRASRTFTQEKMAFTQMVLRKLLR